jgi:hypothetical protein
MPVEEKKKPVRPQPTVKPPVVKPPEKPVVPDKPERRRKDH